MYDIGPYAPMRKASPILRIESNLPADDAVLVDPPDAPNVARAMKTLILDDVQRRDLALAGRARFEATHTPRRHRELWEALLAR